MSKTLIKTEGTSEQKTSNTYFKKTQLVQIRSIDKTIKSFVI